MRYTLIVSLVAAALGACGVSQDKYSAKESEAQKYKTALNDQADKTAALEQQNAALQTKMGTLQKQLSEVSAKMQNTSAQKSALESKTSQLQAETGALKGQRATMLSSQLLFPENSSKLNAEAKRSLDSTADAIAGLQGKAVIIAAYTDDTEGGKSPQGAAKRWQLSSARALEVAKYLSSRGIDPKLMAVAGFGEARAVAPNDSIANRALNRRVEIVLTPAELQLQTVDVAPASLER
jgi:chemotaxis protein MotB